MMDTIKSPLKIDLCRRATTAQLFHDSHGVQPNAFTSASGQFLHAKYVFKINPSRTKLIVIGKEFLQDDIPEIFRDMCFSARITM